MSAPIVNDDRTITWVEPEDLPKRPAIRAHSGRAPIVPLLAVLFGALIWLRKRGERPRVVNPRTAEDMAHNATLIRSRALLTLIDDSPQAAARWAQAKQRVLARQRDNEVNR